jgi:glycosyltransferase involved in cell wall biosynthesis
MSIQPLSAVLITCNEAHRLRQCLETLDFADEILIVDSGSQDDTTTLAEALGCRVIHQDWLGFGAQKHFAVSQAKHEWVLCLDADEQVSPALKTSILETLASPAHQAYEMPRCNRFLGRWLRHGEGYPDWSLRLFHRQHAQWRQDPVHEKVMTQGPVGRLSGDLLHESQETLEKYLEKQNRYTSLQAQQLFDRGRRPSLLRALVSPLVRFVKFYVFKQGFRDGFPGFVHIVIGCSNSFYKQVKLKGHYQAGDSR